MPTFVPDSAAAWRRLLIILAIATIGSVGQWSVVIVMTQAQAQFESTRSAISLAYTSTTLGFALGGVLTGRLTDRLGIVPAMASGILFLLIGNIAAGYSSELRQFIAAQFMIGLGASSTFAPMMSEASHWFVRRRGLAVGIAGSGYYLSGAIWPAVIQKGMTDFGWQTTLIRIGLFSAAVMAVLVLMLRLSIGRSNTCVIATESRPQLDLNLSPNVLTAVLCVASFCCCMAMSIPQVHIVAYCGDLGYGITVGAEMLSLMLACGVISRIGSGFLSDRIGGLATLLTGSAAQALALLMYTYVDGLTSLYIVSALFGLFQGGIVSSYAIIVRETMPAKQAATRVGIVVMVSLLGMSAGGWMAGVIFDMTASYRMAFLNGIAWNTLNILIVLTLLSRRGRVLKTNCRRLSSPCGW